MSLKLNISYNKSTKELVGYSKPVRGEAIVVTAYDVDTLEKKFKKIVEQKKRAIQYVENQFKAMEYLAGQDQRETDLMVQSSKRVAKGK